MEITNLDNLLVAVREGRIEDTTDLPTFGGEEPASTHGVFSWDEERLLVQRASGWQIIRRDEHAA